MLSRNSFILIFVAVALLFACGRSEVKQSKCKFSPRTNMIMMLAGEKMKKWEIDTYAINGTVLDEVTEYHHSGNSNVFFTDHRLEIIRDDEILETGHWYFSEDSSEIEVTLGSKFYIYKLIEISSSELQYICVNRSDTIETVLRTQQL